MDNKFDAIKGAKDSDFLVNLIDSICSYAVANDMSPNDTIVTIAKNMLMIADLVDFDNWGKE